MTPVLEFCSVESKPLLRLSAHFDPGLHIVLGQPELTQPFLALASGVLRPRRGHIRVDGDEPYRSSAARRGIGALFAAEPAPIPARTVRDTLQSALSFQASHEDPDSLLATWSLRGWSQRRTASLSSEERRALALIIAFTDPNRRVLALHDPLNIPSLAAQQVQAQLARANAAGCCLICTASHYDPALGTPASLQWLEPEQLSPNPDIIAASGGQYRLVVRIQDPLAFRALLVNADPKLSVRCGGTDQVILEGAPLSALARAAAQVATDNRVSIRSIVPLSAPERPSPSQGEP